MSKGKKIPYTVEEKEALKVDRELVVRLLNLNFGLTMPELHDKLRDGSCSALEAAIIAVLIKAIMDGDPSRLDYLLSRIIGKVEQRIEVGSSNKYEALSLDELMARKRELDLRNKATIKRIELQRGGPIDE